MTNFNYYKDDSVFSKSSFIDIYKELLNRTYKYLESSKKCIGIGYNQFGSKSVGIKWNKSLSRKNKQIYTFKI